MHRNQHNKRHHTRTNEKSKTNVRIKGSKANESHIPDQMNWAVLNKNKTTATMANVQKP